MILLLLLPGVDLDRKEVDLDVVLAVELQILQILASHAQGVGRLQSNAETPVF